MLFFLNSTILFYLIYFTICSLLLFFFLFFSQKNIETLLLGGDGWEGGGAWVG